MKQKSLLSSIAILFFLSSCVSAEPVLVENSGPDPLATGPSAISATQNSPDVPTVSLPEADIRVIGDEEIVFDWDADRCEPEHIPDLAARAFRDSTGRIQLIISHYINYRMVGPDFDALQSDCTPILDSDFDADEASFNDAEWIAAPYTEDGETIYALVHNEYRGHTHAGKCPSGEYFDCLDTSITLAVSTDAGASYQHVDEPPDHLVATLPHQLVPGKGPFGYRTPSNIIKGNDDFYYSFNNVSDYETQEQWVCLMRTDDLSDPGTWRFWDGDGFNGIFSNPYQEQINNPDDRKCAPLDRDNIGASLSDSVTFNTFLQSYVLVGISADHIEGREVWGFYFSFSHDLINWSKRKLLMEIALPWTVENSGSEVSHLYPTLIDHNSDSRNFETIGKTAYLYFTRMNQGQASLDRDLVRIPIEFSLND